MESPCYLCNQNTRYHFPAILSIPANLHATLGTSDTRHASRGFLEDLWEPLNGAFWLFSPALKDTRSDTIRSAMSNPRAGAQFQSQVTGHSHRCLRLIFP